MEAISLMMDDMDDADMVVLAFVAGSQNSRCSYYHPYVLI